MIHLCYNHRCIIIFLDWLHCCNHTSVSYCQMNSFLWKFFITCGSLACRNVCKVSMGKWLCDDLGQCQTIILKALGSFKSILNSMTGKMDPDVVFMSLSTLSTVVSSPNKLWVCKLDPSSSICMSSFAAFANSDCLGLHGWLTPRSSWNVCCRVRGGSSKAVKVSI